MPLSQISTWPLASWAGLRRTCTVVQLSPRQVAPADLRPHHHRRLGAARAGGHLREETHALAEQRASILKKGPVLHDFPSLKESCLI